MIRPTINALSRQSPRAWSTISSPRVPYGSILGRQSPVNARLLATTSGSPLHEYFVLVWNKEQTANAAAAKSAATETPSKLTFNDNDLILTFAGDMLASAAPSEASAGTLGTVFACQATSEESVRKAVLAHANSVEGLWDSSKIEISALDTVHTGDFERV